MDTQEDKLSRIKELKMEAFKINTLSSVPLIFGVLAFLALNGRGDPFDGLLPFLNNPTYPPIIIAIAILSQVFALIKVMPIYKETAALQKEVDNANHS